MKKWLIACIIFWTSGAMAQEKTCVLSLFQTGTRYDRLIQQAFTNVMTKKMIDPEVVLFREAQIEQINHCFTSSEYREIVFVAHGLSTAAGLTNYSMPIFYNSKTKQKEFLYKRYFENLSRNLADVVHLKKLRVAVCGVDFNLTGNMHSTIDILIQSALQSGIQVDISSKFKFGSWALKEDVTLITKEWLRKSISPVALHVYLNELERRKASSRSRK